MSLLCNSLSNETVGTFHVCAQFLERPEICLLGLLYKQDCVVPVNQIRYLYNIQPAGRSLICRLNRFGMKYLYRFTLHCATVAVFTKGHVSAKPQRRTVYMYALEK